MNLSVPSAAFLARTSPGSDAWSLWFGHLLVSQKVNPQLFANQTFRTNAGREMFKYRGCHPGQWQQQCHPIHEDLRRMQARKGKRVLKRSEPTANTPSSRTWAGRSLTGMWK